MAVVVQGTKRLIADVYDDNDDGITFITAKYYVLVAGSSEKLQIIVYVINVEVVIQCSFIIAHACFFFLGLRFSYAMGLDGYSLTHSPNSRNKVGSKLHVF